MAINKADVRNIDDVRMYLKECSKKNSLVGTELKYDGSLNDGEIEEF